ncbi:MAG TPA: flagellar biosynthesis repressor FlbT [Syntrophales bacterium]|nr:flagellar biosynthesis repressor FlbT [Syntrophales bacterium]
MALKISLKPDERIIIGGAVLRNGGTRSDLVIENSVPVLREKDIMGLADANSPCRRIYFAIQLMYVDEKNIEEHRATYWQLVRDVTHAAPSTISLIDQISEQILHNRYYQALKLTNQLIDYEQGVMNHVRSATAGSL